MIKIINFKQNLNKMSYIYLLAPKGIEEKARLTFFFLKRKVAEYELLQKEITKLKLESEELNNKSR